MVTISTHIGKDLYKTEIKTITNTLIADEPLESGGKDLGFSPSELLAASLGACTSITLRMYADRKGWNLTDVNVEVSYGKDEVNNKSNFIRKIEFTGDLDDDQKARLLIVADSCPIHKALSIPIVIETTSN